MKKVILTTVRTLLAIAAIIGSVLIAVRAYNWQSWCPNNDLGCVLIVTMYLMAASGIMMGFYGISPIFWKAVMAILYKNISNDEESLKDARREILRLRKTWAW